MNGSELVRAIQGARRDPYTPRLVTRNFVFAAILGFGLAACGRSTIAPEPSSTPFPERTTSFPLERTATPVIPTRTPEPPGECPPSPAEVQPEPIEDVLEYGDAFLSYLNAGGSFERMAAFAFDQLVVYTDELHVINYGGLEVEDTFAQPDLSGDRVPELVMSLVDWWDDPQQHGKVYVAVCERGKYRLGYATQDIGYYWTPTIEGVFDITADGLDDLIIRRVGCGAHTCFARLEVVGWANGELRDWMEDVDFELPSTGIEFVGPAADGSYQIIMTGTGVGSIGAGPYRQRSVTWNWNRQTLLFQPGELELLPSAYRIHTVHDGDDSYAAGDYSQALEYYNRVIQDRTLEDWPTMLVDEAFVDARRLELAGYARFRLILTHIKLEDLEAARADYLDLIRSHPSGTAGNGFARMGEAFWKEFTASGDFSAACLAAQEVAAASPDEFQMALDYGYENRTYLPADLCPTDL